MKERVNVTMFIQSLSQGNLLQTRKIDLTLFERLGLPLEGPDDGVFRIFPDEVLPDFADDE